VTTQPRTPSAVPVASEQLPPTQARGPVRKSWADRFAAVWPAVVLVLLLLVGWQLVIRIFDVPNYIVPAPSEVLVTLFDEWQRILDSATWTTLKEVLVGFGIAIVAGMAIATGLHWSALAKRVVYPLLIASQTIPVVVIAPVLAIIFGYGLLPKVILVAVICFFPIVVSMLDGLSSTDPELLRMMRTLHGNRWSSFRKVEFPASLPSLFSGLRIGATYASIGAVFGEYGGSQDGLGYVMIQATPQLLTSLVFAAILLLSAMSMGLFLLVSIVERVVAPWARERG
jgi:putative hydroxymethylpyrimidine transport system permease protein